MDGPHDLGGKDGFGPIDTQTPDFKHDWERRQWALSKNARIPGGTLDWWRHGVERMEPTAYLTRPYFEKWALNDMAQAVDKGAITLEELLRGHADTPAPAPPVRDLAALHDQLRANAEDFSRPMDSAPLYRVGDRVRTRRTPVSGHTRLPAYARGLTGTVIAHHGGHVFADESARGNEVAAHLYTVEFAARDMWGPEADPHDTVCIDLWEPYFDPE